MDQLISHLERLSVGSRVNCECDRCLRNPPWVRISQQTYRKNSTGLAPGTLLQWEHHSNGEIMLTLTGLFRDDQGRERPVKMFQRPFRIDQLWRHLNWLLHNYLFFRIDGQPEGIKRFAVILDPQYQLTSSKEHLLADQLVQLGWSTDPNYWTQAGPKLVQIQWESSDRYLVLLSSPEEECRRDLWSLFGHSARLINQIDQNGPSIPITANPH